MPRRKLRSIFDRSSARARALHNPFRASGDHAGARAHARIPLEPNLILRAAWFFRVEDQGARESRNRQPNPRRMMWRAVTDGFCHAWQAETGTWGTILAHDPLLRKDIMESERRCRWRRWRRTIFASLSFSFNSISARNNHFRSQTQQ